MDQQLRDSDIRPATRIDQGNCTRQEGSGLRILIVSDAWTPQINGVVRTLQRTTAELEARGHLVEVLGPDRFRTVPCPTYPEIPLALDAFWKLPAMIEALRPDAIHIATEGPLGIAARRHCLRTGFPFTTSFHTRFPEYVHARIRLPLAWSYGWLRRFHAPSRCVMVATDSIRQSLRERGFGNLGVWSRGVDTDIFLPPGDAADRDFLRLPRPIHLFVGRVAVEKNLRQFLDLQLDGSKLVVGDGPQRAELQRDYPDAVFAGAKTGQDLVRHFQAADVFVFPSRTDTFGLVLLEALACGLPVAALPVPGPLDVIGESDVGVLDEDLGRAAREALALDRSACRAHALQFSWDNAAAQFLSNLAPAPAAT